MAFCELISGEDKKAASINPKDLAKYCIVKNLKAKYSELKGIVSSMLEKFEQSWQHVDPIYATTRTLARSMMTGQLRGK